VRGNWDMASKSSHLGNQLGRASGDIPCRSKLSGSRVQVNNHTRPADFRCFQAPLPQQLQNIVFKSEMDPSMFNVLDSDNLLVLGFGARSSGFWKYLWVSRNLSRSVKTLGKYVEILRRCVQAYSLQLTAFPLCREPVRYIQGKA
jgi:hypothetical protein